MNFGVHDICYLQQELLALKCHSQEHVCTLTDFSTFVHVTQHYSSSLTQLKQFNTAHTIQRNSTQHMQLNMSERKNVLKPPCFNSLCSGYLATPYLGLPTQLILLTLLLPLSIILLIAAPSKVANQSDLQQMN